MSKVYYLPYYLVLDGAPESITFTKNGEVVKFSHKSVAQSFALRFNEVRESLNLNGCWTVVKTG